MIIKKTSLILILILTLTIFNSNIVNATEHKEDLVIKKRLQSVCLQMNKPCKVVLSPSMTVQAYTTYDGRIILNKGIRDRLSYYQLLAVGMHEVGHHVLNHYERQDDYLSKVPTETDIIAMRHRHELEADLFATSYFMMNNKPNYLPSALRMLTHPQKLNTTTTTHPSYNTRTRVMTNYQNYMTTGQSYRPNNTIYHRPYYLPMKGVY